MSEVYILSSEKRGVATEEELKLILERLKPTISIKPEPLPDISWIPMGHEKLKDGKTYRLSICSQDHKWYKEPVLGTYMKDTRHRSTTLFKYGEHEPLTVTDIKYLDKAR